MRLAAALLALLIATSVQAAPLEAYGRLPILGQVAISPDGARLALVRPDGEGPKIVVQSASEGKVLATLRLGEEKLRGLVWVGNDHLAFITSKASEVKSRNSLVVFKGKGEIPQTRVFDVVKHTIFLVLDRVPKAGNFTADITVRYIDGKPTLFAVGTIISGGDFGQGLFQVDVFGGGTRLIDSSVGQGDVVTNWKLGPGGAMVVRTEYNRKSGDWRLLVRRMEKWAPLVTEKALPYRPSVAGLGAEPETVVVGRLEGGQAVYRSLSLTTGKYGDILTSGDPEPYSIFEDENGRVSLIQANDAKATMTFFSPANQAAWEKAKGAFPGELVALDDWSRDFKQVVLLVRGPKTGNASVLVNLVTGQTSIIDVH